MGDRHSPRGTLAAVAGRAAMLVALFFGVLALALPLPAGAQQPVAKIVSATGPVEIVRAGAARPAAAQVALLAGDLIRTGPGGRAAVLLADESQIRINANSELQVRNVAPPPGVARPVVTAVGTLVNIVKGDVWVKSKEKQFQINTPTVTATIRGTEFVLSAADDGTSRVVVLEGVVDFANPLGGVVVAAGEAAVARVGAPPSKVVILRPQDAVQWIFYYPAITSPRDYPIAPTDPARPGWDQLQQGQTEAAIATLRPLAATNPNAALGLVLGQYRRARFTEAAEALDAALGRFPNHPGLLTQAALFHLLRGEVTDAERRIAAAMAADPNNAPAYALRAVIALTQNRVPDAEAAATAGVKARSDSPSARIALSLVYQARFNLDAAIREVGVATQADPTEPAGWVQLGRLLFGLERLKDAERAAERALQVAPEDAGGLTLVGFLRLTRGDLAGAEEAFTKAIARDSTRAEPHLGMGLLHFRAKRTAAGLDSFLMATTLEPQVSLYQSYLGKALAGVGRREEAVLALKQAETLDPRDPTPHFYKGLLLSDLGRPAESIAELRRATELNDGRAVFRSRLLLDRDLAARTADLAKSYQVLGMNEWAQSLAFRALEDDPTSNAAHLFLGAIQNDLRPGHQAVTDEFIQTLLLAPVSQNTLASLNSLNALSVFNSRGGGTRSFSGVGAALNEYTALLEVPRWSGTLEAAAESKRTWDVNGLVTGGSPRFVVSQFAEAFGTHGVRSQVDFPWRSGPTDPGNDDTRFIASNTLFKYALSPTADLSLGLNYLRARFGDIFEDKNPYVDNDRELRNRSEQGVLRLGYRNQITPATTLLLLGQGNLANFDDVTTIAQVRPFISPTGFGGTAFTTLLTRTDIEEFFSDAQGQVHHRIGDHRLLVGVDYFNRFVRLTSRDEFSLLDVIPFGSTAATITGASTSARDNLLRREFFSAYAQDLWRITPAWRLTLGLRYDYLEDGRFLFNPIRATDALGNRFVAAFDVLTKRFLTNQVSPYAGLTFEPDPKTTFRLGAIRFLQGHNAAGLAPTQVAGILLERTLPTSSRVWQLQAGVDHELLPRVFGSLNVFHREIASPGFTIDDNGQPVGPAFEHYSRTGGTAAVNWILHDYFGLGLDYLYAKRKGLGDEDRDDHQARARLSFVHPAGWTARFEVLYVNQDLGLFRPPGAPRDFVLANFSLSKELFAKRAVVTFAVDNIFKQRFLLESDALLLRSGETLGSFGNREPDRRFSLSVKVAF